MEKIIVVGAGLSGSTIARLFAENGRDVIVMDRREEIAGNVFDFIDENGITVQPYGPHIFHTDNKAVFEFLSRFTEWRKYEHKVLARVRKDKLVPVPFNLTSLFSLYQRDKAERIEKILIEELGFNEKASVLALKKHPNKEVRDFADFVYKYIFYIYTMKQWGFRPEHLGEKVINRVPVRVSYEDKYFSDEYQFMPKDGFTKMVQNILSHPRIKLKLKTDAFRELTFIDGKIYFGGKPFNGTVIYTGCVDELFGYKYGKLPYRSFKYKFSVQKCKSYQSAAVINYTTSAKHTRTIEFSKFTCEPKNVTVIAKEIPVAYKKGKNHPFFAIRLKKNLEIYQKYIDSAKEYKNLFLLGRLALYKDFSMDVAVQKAMELYENILNDDVSDGQE